MSKFKPGDKVVAKGFITTEYPGQIVKRQIEAWPGERGVVQPAFCIDPKIYFVRFGERCSDVHEDEIEHLQ